MDDDKPKELNLAGLVKSDGPVCLVIRAKLEPIGGLDRFQPAGFPEIGHVLYKAPRPEGGLEDVCIVDSAASMANHLETVCFDSPNSTELHPDLKGIPYVVCVTDRNYRVGDPVSEETIKDVRVCTSLTEGHRIASDYFLDGFVDRTWVPPKKEKKKDKVLDFPARWEGQTFRNKLQAEFGITAIPSSKKKKEPTDREKKKEQKKPGDKEKEKYFLYPENWWAVYKTIFRYDPNSLIHGVLFAKEQIKLSRILTAHCEAFGATRVGRSGVKFDRLGKTTSGQPIFAVDEEVAQEIRATFIIDLALLRSYGRSSEGLTKGLTENEKLFLLELAVWKVSRLLLTPFRYRSGCYLQCIKKDVETDDTRYAGLPALQLQNRIASCAFPTEPILDVYYPGNKLFKPPEKERGDSQGSEEDDAQEPEDGEPEN